MNRMIKEYGTYNSSSIYSTSYSISLVVREDLMDNIHIFSIPTLCSLSYVTTETKSDFPQHKNKGRINDTSIHIYERSIKKFESQIGFAG
jgi:hypothetical protein